jgi:hypothetical protein
MNELRPGAWQDFQFEDHRRIVFIGDGVEDEISSAESIAGIITVQSDPEEPHVIIRSAKSRYLVQFVDAPKFGQRVTIDYRIG